MAKFDVSAAAGVAPQAEEKPAAAPKKPAAAKKAPAKKPAAAKKPAPAKAAPKTTSTEVLENLLEEAEERHQGLVQLGLRMPPQLKSRLKATMLRAGLKQEQFVAAAIRRSLDDLDAMLNERDS